MFQRISSTQDLGFRQPNTPDRLLSCSLCGAFIEADMETAAGPECDARLVAFVSKVDQISPVLACLCWLPVVSLAMFKVFMLTYKNLHGFGPWYLLEFLFPKATYLLHQILPGNSPPGGHSKEPVNQPQEGWPSSLWYQYTGIIS